MAVAHRAAQAAASLVVMLTHVGSPQASRLPIAKLWRRCPAHQAVGPHMWITHACRQACDTPRCAAPPAPYCQSNMAKIESNLAKLEERMAHETQKFAEFDAVLKEHEKR